MDKATTEINMSNLLKFLKSQKLLVIASRDAKDIWATNVYIATNDASTMYFVSPESAKHSQMIVKNPEIAFATAWFNEKDHSDRKGIQGVGSCHVTTDVREIMEGVKLLNDSFSDLKKTITFEWVLNNIWKSRMWVIRPKLIKYWDDKIYGDDSCEEFHFDK